ncbi:glycosyltransferase [Noviherbaspirillum suwonense]|jgi:cellulose synthase/poly-beta-1,6-N-acetylglucosamine synthase-like glycosyltransferase|uniref:Glycosyl transferase family 2 n=1 Tax=Noviherbaspirillum suwonense TaxID=1224511 RepID=A0ABY1Q175_9BURK|nr:glycosyltransferase family 2 protein [Noviherbaspirillum suwonense]SMP56098.1 Glycosyl transferase family 2 [Noviherbaspirillum suwonense]
MIGVLIPAHDEEACLADCLDAVFRAAAHPGLGGEQVVVAVALDACSDRSEQLAAAYPVTLIRLDARNVGMARAAAAVALLDAGADWLACTDADTVVADDWLHQQLRLRDEAGADAVCGTISVTDWTPHLARLQALLQRFHASYTDADDHRHIHGANFGVSAQAYRRAGGFQAVTCSEDVALVMALQADGARIAWSAAPRVVTSARIASKARGGFGDTLFAWSMQPPA